MHLYILKYYLVSIIFLVIFYFLGEIFRTIFHISISKKYEHIFLNLFTGILIFVTFIGLYYTKGRTIFSGNIILLLFYIYYNYNKKTGIQTDQITFNYKNTFLTFLFESSCLILCFYVYKYLEVEDLGGFPNWHNQDSVFSSKVAKYIAEVGSENYAFDYIFQSIKSPSPYHYFDIWYASGIANITQLNYFHSLQLLVHPTAFLAIGYGLFATIEKLSNSVSLLQKIALLTIVLFCGIYWDFFNNIPLLQHSGFVYVRSLMNLQKNFIAYLFIIAALNLYLNKKIYLSVLVLLSLTLSQISTLPTLMLSLSIFFGAAFIIKKEKKYLCYFVPIFTIAVFIMLFYTIGKTTDSATAHSDNLSIPYIKSLVSFEFILKVIKISIGEIIQIGAVYFLNIILLIYLFVKYKTTLRVKLIRHQFLILFLFLIIFISLAIAVTSIYIMMDAMQFFSNISIPLINITILLFYVFIMKYISTPEKAILILLIAMTIFYAPKKYNPAGYSSDFLNSTYKLFENSNPIGVCIISEDEYRTRHDCTYPEFGILEYHLCIWNKNAHVIQLTVFDIPKVDNDYPNKVKTSTFYRYVEKQKLKHKFVSITQSQLDFIDEYNIDYLVTSKGVQLNSLLAKRVKEKVIDSETGEIFATLNHY